MTVELRFVEIEGRRARVFIGSSDSNEASLLRDIYALQADHNLQLSDLAIRAGTLGFRSGDRLFGVDVLEEPR